MVEVDGFMLTQGHPVLSNNSWMRADEIGSRLNDKDAIMHVYNLVLESEHSVILYLENKSLLVATAGKFEMGWRYDNVYNTTSID